MITLQDLIDRYGEKELAQLTDRVNTHRDKVIDIAVVDKAISDAEGEIEGYLNAVGLVARDANGTLLYIKASKPPKPLILKACDIARYYLHENATTSIVKERYEQAIDWLKLVMKKPTMLTGVVVDDKKVQTQQTVHVIPNPVPSSWID